MRLNAVLVDVRSNGIQFTPYDIERGGIYEFSRGYTLPLAGDVTVSVAHVRYYNDGGLSPVITVEYNHGVIRFIADLNAGNIIKLPDGDVTSDMIAYQYPAHTAKLYDDETVVNLMVVENDLVINDVRGALLIHLKDGSKIPEYDDIVDSLNQTTLYRLASQFEIHLSDSLVKMLPEDHKLKGAVTVITERWDDEYLITFSNSHLLNSPEYRFHVKYDRKHNQPIVRLIDNREYYSLNVNRWSSKMEVDVSYFNHFDASRVNILALEKLGVFLIDVSTMDETWECHLLNKQAIAGLDDVVQSIIGGELLHREHAIELLSNERFGKLFPFLSTSMSSY